MTARRRSFLQAAAAVLTFGAFEARVAAEVGVKSPLDLIIERNGGVVYEVRQRLLEWDNAEQEPVVGTALTRPEAERLRDLALLDLLRFNTLSEILGGEFSNILDAQEGESLLHIHWRLTRIVLWYRAVALARDDKAAVAALDLDQQWYDQMVAKDPSEGRDLWEEPDVDVHFADLTVAEAQTLHEMLGGKLVWIEERRPEQQLKTLEESGELHAKAEVNRRCQEKAAQPARYSEEEVLKRYRREWQRLNKLYPEPVEAG